jgi:hydroxymethyl cephem carbamoyltransferase
MKEHERDLMDVLLNQFHSHTRKGHLRCSPFWNCGCTQESFRRFAHRFSNAMFDQFYLAIKEVVTARMPLLIGGGCGLNCDWNNRWRDSKLFTDVFVPPCVDDSGVAIGAAVDAQRHFEGPAKVEWSVYAGADFEHDIGIDGRFRSFELNYDHVARLLLDGAAIAWVAGRYEIGPRALGNRSLLAAPFSRTMKDRLNKIKGREEYRPIAPVCIGEHVSRWFAWDDPSPHMLYFQHVLSDCLRAVTHDDGTARVQTVTAGDNARLYKLLSAFMQLSGVGVLCNTSLNYPGRGFINRMSDLARFVEEKELEGMVVDDRLYLPITST